MVPSVLSSTPVDRFGPLRLSLSKNITARLTFKCDSCLLAAEGSSPAIGIRPMFHYAEEQKSVKLKEDEASVVF